MRDTFIRVYHFNIVNEKREGGKEGERKTEKEGGEERDREREGENERERETEREHMN